MIKEYFRLMWRKTLKNKGFTFINIIGLSVGMAVFMIIILWIRNEFSFDSFNKNIDNIYRIEIGGSVYMVSAAAPAFKNEFPEIEKAVRFSAGGKTLIRVDEKSVFVNSLIMADSTLFDIFTYEFIRGNPDDALVTPFSIVLTESTSGVLFGESDPTGKTVKINNSHEFVVTGVIRDVKKTHMPVDAIASFVTLGKLHSEPDYLNSFRTSQYPTYFLISKGADIDKLTIRMTKFTNDMFVKLLGHPVSESEVENKLVPLKDVYLHQPWFPLHLHGNLKFIYIFLLVSVLTLVIACINFINLTIAKSSTVAREVGVKKVFGVSPQQLFIQFLFESVVLCFISSLFAAVIIKLIIPEFNRITGGSLSFDSYLTPGYIIFFFVTTILIGMLAGIYPALKLSSLSPVQYFRKSGSRGFRHFTFRTGLVVFQFTISIILILSVFVVIRQLNYMKNYKTGFDEKNVLVLNLDGDIGRRQESFRNEILGIPEIKDIAFSSAVPGEVNNYEGFEYRGVRQGIPVFTVDPSFLPLIGVKISEGRNFSRERPNDRYGACILNREAVKLWDMDDPVGKILKHEYYLTTIPKSEIEVIGIIDDYHFLSPKDSVGPALFCFGDWYGRASLKIDQTNLPRTLKQVGKIWSDYAPGFPFTYTFLEDSYGNQYKNEMTLSIILVYFAIIAILIGCLGLLGLTSFLAREKTKEIGIRKVYGATGGLIVRLLSSGFLRWVIIAIMIGSPLAVFVMRKWLTNFANHCNITWWLIALAALMLLSISFFTIAYHIVRVSATNPATVLKHE
jgi:putative ABC transport system permease protein